MLRFKEDVKGGGVEWMGNRKRKLYKEVEVVGKFWKKNNVVEYLSFVFKEGNSLFLN